MGGWDGGSHKYQVPIIQRGVGRGRTIPPPSHLIPSTGGGGGGGGGKGEGEEGEGKGEEGGRKGEEGEEGEGEGKGKRGRGGGGRKEGGGGKEEGGRKEGGGGRGGGEEGERGEGGGRGKGKGVEWRGERGLKRDGWRKMRTQKEQGKKPKETAGSWDHGIPDKRASLLRQLKTSLRTSKPYFVLHQRKLLGERTGTNCKTHLDVFPLCFIIQHVCNLLGEDLLSASPGMDTHHGHTDGPGGVADSHGQVRITGLQ